MSFPNEQKPQVRKLKTYLCVRHHHHLLQARESLLHYCTRLWQLVEALLLLYTEPSHHRGPDSKDDEQQSWRSMGVPLSSGLWYRWVQQNGNVILGRLLGLTPGHDLRRYVPSQQSVASALVLLSRCLQCQTLWPSQSLDPHPIIFKATAGGEGCDSILCNCSYGPQTHYSNEISV